MQERLDLPDQQVRAKSILIGRLAAEFHSLGYKVAVIAVDPSSPITGGALLGDRVRMMSISDEIYVRSWHQGEPKVVFQDHLEML